MIPCCTQVDDKMKREIIKNQNYLQSQHDISSSDAALYVNGMHFDMDYTDMFTLLDHIKNEQRAMEGLAKLGNFLTICFVCDLPETAVPVLFLRSFATDEVL